MTYNHLWKKISCLTAHRKANEIQANNKAIKHIFYFVSVVIMGIFTSKKGYGICNDLK